MFSILLHARELSGPCVPDAVLSAFKRLDPVHPLCNLLEHTTTGGQTEAQRGTIWIPSY